MGWLEASTRALLLTLLPPVAGCLPLGFIAATDHSPQGLPVSTSFGVRTMTYLPSHSGAMDGNVETSPLAYHFPASAIQSSPFRAYGFEANVLVVPSRYVYAGVTGNVGWGQYTGAPVTANGLSVQPGVFPNTTEAALGATGGLRLPLGRVALRAGATAGINWLTLAQYASPSGSTALTATGSAAGFLLEPRVDVDYFVTPFCSVNVFATMPYLEPDATNAGVGVTLHLRDFGG